MGPASVKRCSIFRPCSVTIVEFIFPELTFGNTAERRLTLDWSDLRIYDINEKGGNHGILLGTMGWAPMQ